MTDTAEKQDQQALFSLQKVYVKDVSFESPMSPHIFTQQTAPNVDVQLQVMHAELDKEKGFYEAVLDVTVTAKLEDQVSFLAEVKQAGIFQIQGPSEEELPMVLEIACPNILLPFAREAVAELIAKGGFPQLLINPVNFEALYHQKGAQGAEAPAAEAKQTQ